MASAPFDHVIKAFIIVTVLVEHVGNLRQLGEFLSKIHSLILNVLIDKEEIVDGLVRKALGINGIVCSFVHSATVASDKSLAYPSIIPNFILVSWISLIEFKKCFS